MSKLGENFEIAVAETSGFWRGALAGLFVAALNYFFIGVFFGIGFKIADKFFN